MDLQVFILPVAAIVAVIVAFVLWRVFKFVLKKIFAVLGIIAGIAIIAYALTTGQLNLINLLIGSGIIFASLAGFF